MCSRRLNADSLTKLLIAFSLMALCVTIHAMGLMAVFRLIESRDFHLRAMRSFNQVAG